MWEHETAIRVICLASAMVVSIVVGIIGSVIMGLVAYIGGFPPDPVFNATGPLLTLLTFYIAHRRYR